MSFKSFSEIYLSHRSGKGSVRCERSFEKRIDGAKFERDYCPQNGVTPGKIVLSAVLNK